MNYLSRSKFLMPALGALALFLVLSPSPRLQEPLQAPLIIEGPLNLNASNQKSGLKKNQALVRFEISSEIKVFWDETPVASLGVIQTAAGAHQLRLERTGSEPVFQSVEVAADVPTTISLTR